MVTLVKLGKNQKALIKKLPKDFSISSRLMEQGFFLDSEIALAHKSPFQGALAFYLHGTKVCIHQTLAAQIEVEVA